MQQIEITQSMPFDGNIQKINQTEITDALENISKTAKDCKDVYSKYFDEKKTD